MADIVIVPAGLIEEAQGSHRPYTEQLTKKAGAGKIPPAPAREYRNSFRLSFVHTFLTLLLIPSGYSQREAPTIEGTWVRNMGK